MNAYWTHPGGWGGRNVFSGMRRIRTQGSAAAQWPGAAAPKTTNARC